MQAPSQLPAPIDDGACAHLPGLEMPSLLPPSTAGRLIDLSKRDAARTVVYCYSMTGVPGAPLPEGWDLIPGARGCTPQGCAFRDHYPHSRPVECGLSSAEP
jgi:peroxiredoxin